MRWIHEQARRAVVCALVFAMCLAFGSSPVRAQGLRVDVTLTPRDTVVTPGAEFWVSIDVTQATVGYNGWDVVLSYDPTALTYVPVTPRSSQQGCLMVGGCSDANGTQACGNTYSEITAGADSVYVADVLLCNQIFLTGPGRLFLFKFRASNTPKVTYLRFRKMRFATTEGVMNGIYSADAVIGIGQSLAEVAPGGHVGGVNLSVVPNPARGAVTLSVDSDRAGEQSVAVHDVLGRRVRSLSRGWQAAGRRDVMWDARDDAGARVAPGVYLVTLRVADRVTRQRVTVLE